jgi:hypothetical protein
VQLSSPATGEVLAYNGTAGRWENAEVVSLGLNVATSNLQNGQYLKYADGLWVNDDLVVYGSVNSVGLNMPTGFTVTNSPITNSGTLGVTYAEGYSLPATSTQDNWNSAFGWGNHQAVGYIVGLANDTVTDNNISAFNGTTGKLLKDTGVAISSVNTAIAHTTLTNNPHSVTKTQVGLANVADVLQATTQAYSGIITSGGWSGSGPFTKEITVTGILSTDQPIIDLDLSEVTFANVPTIQEAWGKIYRAVTTANTINFSSTEALTTAISFIARVVR